MYWGEVLGLGYENFAKVWREYILPNNSNNLWLAAQDETIQ